MGGIFSIEVSTIIHSIVCIYMTSLFLISNMAAHMVRAYKRSLPCLRVNIVLILNSYLIQAINIVTSLAVTWSKLVMGIIYANKHIISEYHIEN